MHVTTPLRHSLVLGILALTLVVSLPAPAHARLDRHRSDIEQYVIPGEAVFPEGIAAGRRGEFFVSSTADGTIYRGHRDQAELEVFLPGGQDGRTTAIGLEVDRRGRLWVAGGDTGRLWVYDTGTGTLLASYDNGLGATEGATFVNDIVVTRDAAYVTDSFSPRLLTVPAGRDELGELELLVDFTGTPFEYVAGAFNANGIVASRDGDTLVVVQADTGRLFRVDTGSAEVTEVDLGGATVPNGDGMLLERRNLYVVQNFQELVTRIELDDDLSGGRVVASVTDPDFKVPTTIDRVGRELLVVNSQFDVLFGQPGATLQLPFDVVTVSDPIPD